MRVNPLGRMTLVRDLLFVDGRREAEIAWALDREDESGRRSKIVLLAGRPLDLMPNVIAGPSSSTRAAVSRPGSGCVLRRALVEQAGSKLLLRITEIPVEDRADPGSVSGAGLQTP